MASSEAQVNLFHNQRHEYTFYQSLNKFKMADFRFQIMSDLHLETPNARPSYDEFEIKPQCPCLALLGDIGNVSDPRHFGFLDRQLRQFELIFYLLGNHEPYGTTFPEAKAALRAFEADVEKRRCSADSKIGKFVFLDRRRYDCSEELTVLGCTLFSFIKPEQRDPVARFVSDFSNINNWTIESHNAAHQSDLQWLNSQLSYCARNEPHRSIVVLTHHSPTTLEAANDPRHMQDRIGVQSAFVTDISEQICWTSPQVKLWAFGHTHFNCDLEDPRTRKRVMANQKGYRRAEVLAFDGAKVVRAEADSHLRSRTLKEVKGEQASSTKQKHCTVS